MYCEYIHYTFLFTYRYCTTAAIVVLILKPFGFEGRRRMQQAQDAINEMKDKVPLLHSYLDPGPGHDPLTHSYILPFHHITYSLSFFRMSLLLFFLFHLPGGHFDCCLQRQAAADRARKHTLDRRILSG